MKVNILAFGIAKDIIKGKDLEVEVVNGSTIADLKALLCRQFPDFKKLASLRVAVNSEYAEDDQVLQTRDEVVLIPPVSGG